MPNGSIYCKSLVYCSLVEEEIIGMIFNGRVVSLSDLYNVWKVSDVRLTVRKLMVREFVAVRNGIVRATTDFLSKNLVFLRPVVLHSNPSKKIVSRADDLVKKIVGARTDFDASSVFSDDSSVVKYLLKSGVFTSADLSDYYCLPLSFEFWPDHSSAYYNNLSLRRVVVMTVPNNKFFKLLWHLSVGGEKIVTTAEYQLFWRDSLGNSEQSHKRFIQFLIDERLVERVDTGSFKVLADEFSRVEVVLKFVGRKGYDEVVSYRQLCEMIGQAPEISYVDYGAIEGEDYFFEEFSSTLDVDDASGDDDDDDDDTAPVDDDGDEPELLVGDGERKRVDLELRLTSTQILVLFIVWLTSGRVVGEEVLTRDIARARLKVRGQTTSTVSHLLMALRDLGWLRGTGRGDKARWSCLVNPLGYEIERFGGREVNAIEYVDIALDLDIDISGDGEPLRFVEGEVVDEGVEPTDVEDGEDSTVVPEVEDAGIEVLPHVGDECCEYDRLFAELVRAFDSDQELWSDGDLDTRIKDLKTLLDSGKSLKKYRVSMRKLKK